MIEDKLSRIQAHLLDAIVEVDRRVEDSDGQDDYARTRAILLRDALGKVTTALRVGGADYAIR